jgi:hypothetical protein
MRTQSESKPTDLSFVMQGRVVLYAPVSNDGMISPAGVDDEILEG